VAASGKASKGPPAATTPFLAFIEAAARGHYQAVLSALDSGGINVNEQDENGFTALIEASSSGYKDVVTLLLQRGASLD
jgi:ankyrin repeat protein